MDIFKENKDLSDFSGQGYDLSGIKPDILCTPRKNKRKKNQTLRLLEKNLFEKQSTLEKGQKRIL